MKAMQVALILLCVVAASVQVLRLGKCSQPAVQANFDANRVNTKLLFFFALLLFMLQETQPIVLVH